MAQLHLEADDDQALERGGGRTAAYEPWHSRGKGSAGHMLPLQSHEDEITMKTFGIWFFITMIALTAVMLVIVIVSAIRDPNETWKTFWGGPGIWR